MHPLEMNTVALGITHANGGRDLSDALLRLPLDISKLVSWPRSARFPPRRVSTILCAGRVRLKHTEGARRQRLAAHGRCRARWLAPVAATFKCAPPGGGPSVGRAAGPIRLLASLKGWVEFGRQSGCHCVPRSRRDIYAQRIVCVSRVVPLEEYRVRRRAGQPCPY